MQRIGHFVDAWNASFRRCKRIATTVSIIEKLHRLCSLIDEIGS
ncbi:hypothetical protein AB4142_20525 [Variovorax sp. 2RAF20]|nr:hypothetical protein [Variovorax sp. CF313]